MGIADSVESSDEDTAGPSEEVSYNPSCDRRRMFRNHVSVYRLKMDSEPRGLGNRNAASLEGIYSLLAGAPSKSLEGWGLKRYNHNHGVLEKHYLSYTKFGTYQACNIENGKNECHDCTRTQCCCGSPNPPLNASSPSSYVLPGRLKTW